MLKNCRNFRQEETKSVAGNARNVRQIDGKSSGIFRQEIFQKPPDKTPKKRLTRDHRGIASRNESEKLALNRTVVPLKFFHTRPRVFSLVSRPFFLICVHIRRQTSKKKFKFILKRHLEKQMSFGTNTDKLNMKQDNKDTFLQAIIPPQVQIEELDLSGSSST